MCPIHSSSSFPLANDCSPAVSDQVTVITEWTVNATNVIGDRWNCDLEFWRNRTGTGRQGTSSSLRIVSITRFPSPRWRRIVTWSSTKMDAPSTRVTATWPGTPTRPHSINCKFWINDVQYIDCLHMPISEKWIQLRKFLGINFNLSGVSAWTLPLPKKGKQKSPGRATSRSRSQPLTPGGREKVTRINVCIANKQMHNKHKDQLPLPEARWSKC